MGYDFSETGYDFSKGYELYINKDGEVKITKLRKNNYIFFYAMLESLGHDLYGDFSNTEVCQNIYYYNENYYFSFNRKDLKKFSEKVTFEDSEKFYEVIKIKQKVNPATRALGVE